MNRTFRVATAFIILSAGTGCTPDDQRTDSIDLDAARQERESWDPHMIERLDAGNLAIRTDSFDVARAHYLAVVEMAPEVAAGWFGLYLAEQGRGDEEAAAEALERVRGLAAGATLIHPQREDSIS